jgi:hypothetical protein
VAVSAGTYGACNDKTLIRFDDFIRELRENPLYTTNIEYKLKVNPTAIVLCLSCVHLFSFFKVDDLGTEETIKGVYVIVDGGYHKWRATISASRHGQGLHYTEWREKLESVRKDIECGAFVIIPLVVGSGAGRGGGAETSLRVG